MNVFQNAMQQEIVNAIVETIIALLINFAMIQLKHVLLPQNAQMEGHRVSVEMMIRIVGLMNIAQKKVPLSENVTLPANPEKQIAPVDQIK